MNLDNPFWRFSLELYSAPGVAAECIHLQDCYGVNVNILLFAAWLGTARSLVLTTEQFKLIEVAVGEWQREVVIPIREARRRIKMIIDQDGVLYEHVKRAELRLEQVEQAKLYALSESLQGLTAPAKEEAICSNIASYCSQKRVDKAPEVLIAAAIARLGALTDTNRQ